MLHLRKKGESEWEVDAALTDVVLQRVLNCYGGWQSALKEKDPHWEVVDLIQNHYAALAQPNLIQEAADVMALEAAAREQWLESHMISHLGATHSKKRALVEATRVSERVYAAQLPYQAALAADEEAAGADSECGDEQSVDTELTPGSKRSKLLQIKNKVREQVQLNQQFKVLLAVPAAALAEEATGPEEEEAGPAKKKRKPAATTIGLVRHKAIVAAKDKEISKLKAENAGLINRLADHIVQKHLPFPSNNSALQSTESAPSSVQVPVPHTPSSSLQSDFDQLSLKYKDLHTAAMMVSFEQSAANIKALQHLLIKQ